MNDLRFQGKKWMPGYVLVSNVMRIQAFQIHDKIHLVSN